MRTSRQLAPSQSEGLRPRPNPTAPGTSITVATPSGASAWRKNVLLASRLLAPIPMWSNTVSSFSACAGLAEHPCRQLLAVKKRTVWSTELDPEQTCVSP